MIFQLFNDLFLVNRHVVVHHVFIESNFVQTRITNKDFCHIDRIVNYDFVSANPWQNVCL